MRSLLVLVTALSVMALAFWVYRENYRTQAELRDLRALQSEIAQLREALGVYRAEWAYLNRPDRLRDLADTNFGRLGLLPLDPGQFGQVEQVTYPVPPLLPITEPVETSGTLAGGEDDAVGDAIAAAVAAAQAGGN